MRPVVKDDGAGRAYADYADALDDLASQIGLYCSYCEIPIKNAPEVEHVQPKSLQPQLRLDWNNFLLGCKSCNTTKGNRPVDTHATAFPDKDNTFRGLTFNQSTVTIAAGLLATEMTSIKNVVQLVKLHRHPLAANRQDRPTKADRRHKLRGEAWLVASEVKHDYLTENRDPTIKKLICEHLAPATGFFSVWMTVFSDHPEMLNGFIEAFTGTAQDCFDANGKAIPRPNGLL
jgi:uncharacterized protein (TIGR02646 family)